jgi:hypothetical protein
MYACLCFKQCALLGSKTSNLYVESDSTVSGSLMGLLLWYLASVYMLACATRKFLGTYRLEFVKYEDVFLIAFWCWFRRVKTSKGDGSTLNGNGTTAVFCPMLRPTVQ